MPELQVTTLPAIQTVEITIELWQSGLISDHEVIDLLSDHEVHGGVEDGQLTAFDYLNQQWITA